MANIFYKCLKDDEEALKVLNSSKIELTGHACYSEYNDNYQGDDSESDIYFGFFAHPNIQLLVDEMNENLENIKVTIIGTKRFKVSGEHAFFDTIDEYKMYNYCMFKVSLNDKYTVESNFVLKLIIAQFVRGYCPYYAHFKKMVLVTENFIDGNLSSQNTGQYGGWLCCDLKNNYCDRETFNKLDDIELMNKITGDGRTDFSCMPSIHRIIRVLDGTMQIDYAKRKKFSDIYD